MFGSLKARRPKLFLLAASSLGSLLVLFLLLPVLAIFILADPEVLGEALLRDPLLSREAYRAFIITVEASTTSTAVLLVLGIPLAYVLARTSFRGKHVVEALIDAPLMLPHAVAGIMVLAAYGRGGLLAPFTREFGIVLEDSYWGIVAVMTFVSAPIMIDTVKVGIESIDPELEIVARSLGAGPARVFATIVLPLSLRSIGVGFVLSWARAISEVGAILIVAYYPKSINVLIIEWFNTYGLSYAIALSIPLVLLSLTLFTVVRWVLAR